MDSETDAFREIAGRNLRFGWYGLVIFSTIGVILESMHGFKVGWYLDVGNEVRRLMWTLAHAHGGLMAIVNILFSLSVRIYLPRTSHIVKASSLLITAMLLFPLGFFLGGAWTHGGDPSIGIVLVPVGALCFIAGLVLTAIGLRRV